MEIRAGVQVEGITVDDGRITGVLAGGHLISAEVVVDAMGRRSPMRSWLSTAGQHQPRQSSSECGVIYYTRYYRLRDGANLEDGPWLVSPRGDLGYMGFASFPGDQGTFAAVLAVPTGVPEFKTLRYERVFEAAVATIGQLRMWVDINRVDPITPVMPMGGLQNTLNHYTTATPRGLFAVGDALCHTDPVLAHGLSFSVVHGREVAIALRAHADVGDAFDAYLAQVMPALHERFDLATALDEQRHRMWTGQHVDFAHRTGDFALFTMVAAAAVAMMDGDVGRAYVRRIGLLDSTRVLDDDVPLQERIEALFLDLLAKPRAPQGPPREEMLTLCSLAADAVKT